MLQTRMTWQAVHSVIQIPFNEKRDTFRYLFFGRSAWDLLQYGCHQFLNWWP